MKRLLIAAVVISVSVQVFYWVSGHLYRWVPHDSATTITAYGRPSCPLTRELQSGLDRNRIPYEFIDVDKSGRGSDKMWRLVWKAHGEEFRDVVLPVVT